MNDQQFQAQKLFFVSKAVCFPIEAHSAASLLLTGNTIPPFYETTTILVKPRASKDTELERKVCSAVNFLWVIQSN